MDMEEDGLASLRLLLLQALAVSSCSLHVPVRGGHDVAQRQHQPGDHQVIDQIGSGELTVDLKDGGLADQHVEQFGQCDGMRDQAQPQIVEDDG